MEVLGGLVLHLAGGAAFALREASTWEPWHYVAWSVVLLAAMEAMALFSMMVGKLFRRAGDIPHRGKHLDQFELIDLAFLSFNKLCTPLFVYHTLRVVWTSAGGVRMVWTLQEADVFNTLGALIGLYVVFDFFYMSFHRALHHGSVYKFVHKHHHRQKAPSRGNSDAINVHPFEYVVGEYNHLFSLWIVSRFFVPVHVIAAGFFIFASGVLASLNHTRYDVQIPGIYKVLYHDIHHWYPDCNYSQYTMLWDYVFGSFKPYPSDDAGVKGSGSKTGSKAKGPNGSKGLRKKVT